MNFPLLLFGKLKRRRTLTGLAADSTHATATAKHFPANAGFIFLTNELTNDRYLVDTGAALSIVPCIFNAGPSGPLLKGADGPTILSWGFVSKTVQFQGKLFTAKFFKPQWQVPFWALISLESSESLLLQKPTKYCLLVLGASHRQNAFAQRFAHC